MKKQLAILSALLAVNTTASAAFDAEFQLVADPYAAASMNYKVKGEKSEVFNSSYPIGKAFQNFGFRLQGQYEVYSGLHLGAALGFYADMMYDGKTDVPVEYRDTDGDIKNDDKKKFNIKLENNTIKQYDVKKGGFFHIPLLITGKYDLPVALEDYALNFYVSLRGGIVIPISNEDGDEHKNYKASLLNFHGIVSAGAEMYGFQLEAGYSYLGVNYTYESATASEVSDVTFGSINAKKAIEKNYSRHGLHLNLGYRLADLF